MVTTTDLINFWIALTKRQRKAVEFLAAGLSNQAIAANMAITPKTVEAHLVAVATKLRHHDLLHDGAKPRPTAVKVYTILFCRRRTRVWF